MTSVRPVILCGGAGTRLWPMSRPDRPKPLLPFGEGRTLLADTLLRLRGEPFADPVALCGVGHAEAIAAEAPTLPLWVEPIARGTAAAAAVAAASVPEDTLIFLCPADHAVGRPEALREAVSRGIGAAAAGALVVFGVRPDRPETGFGWIRPDDERRVDGLPRVARFEEKPDRARAEALFAEGCWWNAGMFLFRAGSLLDEMRRLVPGLAEAAGRAVRGATGSPARRLLDRDAMAAAPTGSLDVRVAERTADAVVVAVDLDWADLGTWPAVAARTGAVGPVLVHDCPGTWAASDGPRVVVLGVPDAVVVATGGAVLVASRERSAEAGAWGARVEPSEAVVDSGPGWTLLRRTVGPGEGFEVGAHERVTVVAGLACAEGAASGAGSALVPGGYRAQEAPVVLIVLRFGG